MYWRFLAAFCYHSRHTTTTEHQLRGRTGAAVGRYDIIAILAGTPERRTLFAFLETTLIIWCIVIRPIYWQIGDIVMIPTAAFVRSENVADKAEQRREEERSKWLTGMRWSWGSKGREGKAHDNTATLHRGPYHHVVAYGRRHVEHNKCVVY